MQFRGRYCAHSWCNGGVTACHVGGAGSILAECIRAERESFGRNVLGDNIHSTCGKSLGILLVRDQQIAGSIPATTTIRKQSGCSHGMAFGTPLAERRAAGLLVGQKCLANLLVGKQRLQWSLCWYKRVAVNHLDAGLIPAAAVCSTT